MKRSKNTLVSLLACMILIVPATSTFSTPVSRVHAEENQAAVPSKETIKHLLTDTYKAQIGLSKPKPLRDVKNTMGKYMTARFEKQFLKERLVVETAGQHKGMWSVPGSDDMYLFIPDYSWDKRTVVQKGQNQSLYVSQFYQPEEGPWSIGAHTETVVLLKEKGKWKIGNILYEEGEKLLH